ncbi:MAG: extracellular solute-binding protein [Candidatus Marinimicrobia bacterium]|nr:extracellular solute-binding protein [Candidatus Neomarinimicrobiota bacterium]
MGISLLHLLGRLCATAQPPAAPATLRLGFSGSAIERATLQDHLARYTGGPVALVEWRWPDGSATLPPAAPPDVFLLDAQWVAEAAPHVLPRPDLEAAAFHPTAWQAVQADGQTMAAPWTCLVSVLFVNRAALDRVQRPLPAHWTWPEFLARARQLTVRATDGSVTQWGYMALSDQYSEDAEWIELAGGAWGPNMYFHPATVDAGAEAMRFVSDLSYVHQVAPTAAQWRSDYLDRRTHPDFRHTPYFADGHFGLFKGRTWHLNELNRLDMPEGWDMAPLPAHRRAGGGVQVLALAISRACAQPAAARALVDYLLPLPERGVPALLDPDVRARFVKHYELEQKNYAILFAALDHGRLHLREARDPRLSDPKYRTRPWHLKKQPWTDAVDAEYRATIEAFGLNAPPQD